jgi:uncharacterized membrane protein
MVYWMRAQAMMVDPSVASLTSGQAIWIGVAGIVASWIVYDVLCRSPLGGHDAALGIVVFGLLTLLALERAVIAARASAGARAQ